VVDGHIESCEESGHCVVMVDGLRLSGCSSATIGVDAPVLAVLRYERISLLPQDAPQGFPGVVVTTSYLGSTSRIRVQLDNGPLLTSEVISNQANGEIPVGARVRAHWAPQDLIVFRE